MILAIDVGNSNIVIGIIDGDNVVSTMRISTDMMKTADEYAMVLKNVLDFEPARKRDMDGAIISSVVPPLTDIFYKAVKLLTGLEALIVGSGLKTGLNIMIDNPGQLGADLVAGAVAALSAYKPPLIIFDLGTATTISVIDSKSNYLGGAIVPGTELSFKALSSGTSQLPKISIDPPKRCISSNTIDCMKSGAVFGTAAMMDGMIERIEQELGEKVTVIATGGLSQSIVPFCKREIVCDGQLLLKGLYIIYQKNKRR